MVFDLHNDALTAQNNDEKVRQLGKTGNKIVCAYWTSELKTNVPYLLEAAQKKVAHLQNIYFAIEDLHFIHTEMDINFLRNSDAIYCGLTWNYDNALAGGALTDGTLSNLGKKVIETCNALRIMIDTAHLNRKSFFAVLDKAENVLCSHTALYELQPHARNLDQEQIKQLLNRGGVVGLTAVSSFLGGDTVQDYMKHLDRFAQKYGIEGLCIGTDFNGTLPIKGLENYEDFFVLKEQLLKWGYTEKHIQQIFYKNAEDKVLNRR